MRSKFLQDIIDETPFCVEYRARKLAEKLKQNNMEKLEFKGTKKPWVLHETVNENGRYLFTVCNEGYNNENTDFIIQKSTISEVEILRANMKLEAGAPDLLEALQKITPVFEQLASFGNINVDNLECYKKSIKAIEKALK